jgi:hypothetical protein
VYYCLDEKRRRLAAISVVAFTFSAFADAR